MGVSRLDDALGYVTGPAWSTADGAMEGSIGIEAQMLAVERFVSGIEGEAQARELFEEGIAMEEEALSRMEEAGLIEAARVNQLHALRDEFHVVRDALWHARQSDAVTDAQLRTYIKAANALLDNVEEVEMLGDAQVESRIGTIRSATDTSYVVIIVVAFVAILIAAFVSTLIVRSVTRPMARAIRIAERIGSGDLSEEIENADGNDEASVMLRALAGMQQQMRERIETERKFAEQTAAEQRVAEMELERALNEAIHGRLGTRLRTGVMKGFLAKVGEQVNHMLDAIVTPLNETADYLARISRGDIPDRITRSYEGDFDTIKSNLNSSIEAIDRLLTDTRQVALAARRGAVISM